jgi:hypothetical protein
VYVYNNMGDIESNNTNNDDDDGVGGGGGGEKKEKKKGSVGILTLASKGKEASDSREGGPVRRHELYGRS